MPKRIVDGEALWRSKKLKNISAKYRAEYANLIPLAEANGSFDADPHRVWADVYSFNRPDITLKDVVRILDEFEKAEMLKRWEENGKIWGYWIGIDKPGRLPVEAHLTRYKNLPPEAPGLSRTIPDGTGEVPSGIGIGIGSGIGKGLDREVKLAKELPRLCRQILGIRPERADFQVWGEVKELAKAYGSQKVADAFSEWATINQGRNIGYPISEFMKVADGIIGGLILLQKRPELQTVLDRIAVESSNDMVFAPEQIVTISKLLETYGEDLLMQAFRDFYGRIEDDFQRKRAAKDFADKAEQFIRTIRLQKQQEEQTQREMELGRQQLEATAPVISSENEQTDDDAWKELEVVSEAAAVV